MSKGRSDIFYYDGCEKEPSKTCSYGDFRETDLQDKNHVLYNVPDMMSYGDYANTSLLHVSNFRVFWKDYGELDGVHELIGGYGIHAIAIRWDVAENNDEIRKVLAGLEDYPLISEEDHSELEQEKIDEAWDGWMKDDFIRAILKSDPKEYFSDLDETSLKRVIRSKIFKTTYKKMRDPICPFFYECRDEAQEEWEDDYGTMFIRLEKIIPIAADRLLLHIVPHRELPLLIGRDWASDDMKREFENRLKGVSSS